MRPLSILSAASLLLVAVSLRAEPLPPLPEPLTLEAALSALEAGYPQLELIAAERDSAQAQLQARQSDDDLRITLQGRAQWIEPSQLSPNQSSEDHQALLFASKTLYDFGVSSAREASAAAQVENWQQRYLAERDQHRLLIISRYFDVLLADLAMGQVNEAMSVAFISLDRLRDRQELGQVSDLMVAEAQVAYQKVLSLRSGREQAQRSSRALLAIALNRPAQLSAQLVEPEAADWKQPLPDYEPLLKLALEQNPGLKGLRASVDAASSALEAARNSDGLQLRAEAEAFAYQRDMPGRDHWRARLMLELPLYNGGRRDAAVAAALADKRKTELRLWQAENEVRQAVLEQWQRIARYRVEQQEASANQEYRDLYLDRSRAIYELEVKSDLGDSMVQYSQARLQRLQVEYGYILAWEQLKALLGGVGLEALQQQMRGEEQQGG